MPNNEDDVQFSFDPKPFMKAMDGMTAALNKFEKTQKGLQVNAGKNETDRVSKSKKNMTEMSNEHKKTSSSMVKQFSLMALAAGAVALAIKGINKAMSFLPEVGQAFKMAGDVIAKNLFWPLRQAIMPYLQKMLDWVRDSRSKFVAWGQRIANVFRAVAEVVKTAWGAIKAMGHALDNLLGGRLSKMLSGEFFDVVSFKIASVFIFARLQMEKMFGSLENIFAGIGRLGTSFFEGLMSPEMLEKYRVGFDKFGDAVGKLWAAFDKLWTAFTSNPKVNAFFEFMGKLTGEVFVIALKGVTYVIEQLATAMERLAQVISGEISFSDWFWGKGTELPENVGTPGKGGRLDKPKTNMWGGGDATMNKPFVDLLGEWLKGSKGVTEVNDAILRKDGSIVKTNPQDTILALKSPSQSISSVENNRATNVTNNITINATGIKDTMDQLTAQIRAAIYGELSSSGVR